MGLDLPIPGALAPAGTSLLGREGWNRAPTDVGVHDLYRPHRQVEEVPRIIRAPLPLGRPRSPVKAVEPAIGHVAAWQLSLHAQNKAQKDQ